MDTLITIIYDLNDIYNKYLNTLLKQNISNKYQSTILFIQNNIKYIDHYKNKIISFIKVHKDKLYINLEEADLYGYLYKYVYKLETFNKKISIIYEHIKINQIQNESTVSLSDKQSFLYYQTNIDFIYNKYNNSKKIIVKSIDDILTYIKKFNNDVFVNYLSNKCNKDNISSILLIINRYIYFMFKHDNLDERKRIIKDLKSLMIDLKNKYIISYDKNDNDYIKKVNNYIFLLNRNKLIYNVNHNNNDNNDNNGLISVIHNIDIEYNLEKLLKSKPFEPNIGINNKMIESLKVINYKIDDNNAKKKIEINENNKSLDHVYYKVNDKYLTPWKSNILSIPSKRINNGLNQTLKSYNHIFNSVIDKFIQINEKKTIIRKEYVIFLDIFYDDFYKFLQKIDKDNIEEPLFELIKILINNVSKDINVKSRFQTYFNLYKMYLIKHLYTSIYKTILKYTINNVELIYDDIKMLLNKQDNILDTLISYDGYARS
jgi:hypothetical protein